MSAKHQDTQKHSKQHETKQPKAAQAAGKSERLREKDDAVRRADEAVQKDKNADKRPDRTAGQNRAVDEKRDDEQQHAGGVAHDPHNRTQQRVNSGNPDAGDIDEETRSDKAPFNKTYGHRE